MRARAKIAAASMALLAAPLIAGACGTQGIQVSRSSPYYRGAVLFRDHCSGCHTLSTVGAEGSATSIRNRVRTNGPDFNIRKENPEQVLYAIRNGGFSGAIMPQNIVLGEDAQSVANFPPEAKNVPVVGAFSGVDVEKIVDLGADLVIAGGNGGTPPDAIAKLRSLKVPVLATVKPRRAGLLRMLVVQTPFDRFSTDDGRMFDAWTGLVKAGGWDVSYLLTRPGKAALRDRDLAAFHAQGDFTAVAVQPDHFLYADPPYDVEFTTYSPGGFTWEDQVRLAEWLAHPRAQQLPAPLRPALPAEAGAGAAARRGADAERTFAGPGR